MITIQVTAFRRVPPFAQSLVRDLRVRWALAEAGVPYEERLIGPDQQRSPEYCSPKPFGQPAYLEDGLTLFESAASVLRIAAGSEALLPADPQARAGTESGYKSASTDGGTEWST